MNIREVRPPKRRPKRVRRVFLVLLWGVIVLVTVAGAANYLRPLPNVSHSVVPIANSAAEPTTVAWPKYGQAALATSEQGVLQTSGPQAPLATASIAKVVTALCVLEKYPLKANQTGPTLTLTAVDVALYDNYLAKDGSVSAVQAGEQITERQLLEGIMLPSANNLADSAAIWAYGNLEAYADYANKYLAMHGLTNTHVGTDASGFDPSSTSTASDLARLGLIALQQPALAQIMAEPKADLPVAGTVRNYNSLLGSNGVVGIKTGNNDQNPGAMLFAANIVVGTQKIAVSGALMGAGSLNQALKDSATLVTSLAQNFSRTTVIAKGQTLVTYTTPWGPSAQAVAVKDATLVHWNGTDVTAKVTISDITPSELADKVGHVRVASGLVSTDVQLQLNHPLAGPSFWWRLTRH